MSKIKRALHEWTPITAVVATITGAVITIGAVIGKPEEREINKLLEEVIVNQETTLGIKHYGRPRVVTEKPEWLSEAEDFLGQYNPQRDEIYLNKEKLIVNGILDEEKARRTIAHELGHFYADKLSEELGRGSWPDLERKRDLEALGIQIASEGIAEHFRTSIYPNEEKEYERPNRAGEFLRGNTIYPEGRRIATPIIEAFGSRGIEYIIRNPPKPIFNAELSAQLDTYQISVMSILEQ